MYTHKQVQLVGSGPGLGEAFLSVHPQLISIFQASVNPKENTDAPTTKIHIYIIIYICVCK